MNFLHVLVIVIFSLLLIKQECSIEGFNYFKPGDIDKRVAILSKSENKKYFSPAGVYSKAAVRFNWLDPVTYYDLVNLQYKNSYTADNIRKIFEY